jgi:hypothetical protein
VLLVVAQEAKAKAAKDKVQTRMVFMFMLFSFASQRRIAGAVVATSLAVTPKYTPKAALASLPNTA